MLAIEAKYLADVCFTAANHRSLLGERAVVLGSSKKELIGNLHTFLSEDSVVHRSVVTSSAPIRKKMVFVFSGQGPQWYAMGKELLASNPIFKQYLKDIDILFQDLSGYSLIEEMRKDEEHSRIAETKIAQPAIMAVQIGVAEVLKSVGVIPDAVIGHSIGEVAASYVAGALSLKQAVTVIFNRSKEQDKASGKGEMLAIGMTAQQAVALIEPVKETVSIAAINGPDMIVLSGDAENLHALSEQLDQQEIFNRFLKVNVPFHSHLMEPLEASLVDALKDLKPKLAEIPIYSTVTGMIEQGTHCVAEYWYQNVREPVLFAQTISHMVQDGYDLFIEISPHPVLSGGMEAIFDQEQTNAAIIPTLKRKVPEVDSLNQAITQIMLAYENFDIDKLFPGASRLHCFPRYPWEHKQFWAETVEQVEGRVNLRPHPFINSVMHMATDKNVYIASLNFDQRVHLFLEDHVVNGALIVPATALMEVVLAAGNHIFGKDITLEELFIEKPLFLPENPTDLVVRLEIQNYEGNFFIVSKKLSDPEDHWTTHVKGKINTLDSYQASSEDYDAINESSLQPADIRVVYQRFEEMGFQFGNSFQVMRELKVGQNKALASINGHASIEHEISKFLIHPTLLDSAFQTLSTFGDKQMYLPTGMHKFKLIRPLATQVCYSYTCLVSKTSDYLEANIFLFDQDHQQVAEIEGFRVDRVHDKGNMEACDAYDGSYNYLWENAELDTVELPPTPQGCIILLGASTKTSGLIEKTMVAKGAKVVCVDANVLEQQNVQKLIGLLSKVKAEQGNIERILYLPLFDQSCQENQFTEMVLTEQAMLNQGLVNLSQALIAIEANIKLWVVTQNAHRVSSRDRVNLAHSTLIGTARVMMGECPQFDTFLVDVSDIREPLQQKALLLLIFKSTWSDKEFALREKGTFVHKIFKLDPEDAERNINVRQMPQSGFSYTAEVFEKGILNSIVFRALSEAPLTKNQIRVDMRAVGMNFKDVLNAQGILSPEAVADGYAGQAMGLEGAGIVSLVGVGVTNFKVGDRVVFSAKHCYSGKITLDTRGDPIALVPNWLSFEEAATLPVVFCTAHYALNVLAKIRAGDKVLIHSAAGGLGLAAIQLAHLAGAEVIATTSTAAKKAVIKNFGVKHIFNSRSLDFRHDVMRVTKNEGVDIVLNFLTGPALIQSLKCLKAGGCFIEVGKTELYNNGKLPLENLGHNISFMVLDLDRLRFNNPCDARKTFQDVMSYFDNKKLKPIPCKTFNICDLGRALTYMSQAKHTGKVVVCMDQQGTVPTLPPKTLQCDGNGSYLIIGLWIKVKISKRQFSAKPAAQVCH